MVVEHRVVDRDSEVGFLGDVHRDVGVLQQRGEVAAVIGRDRDADTGLDVEADSFEDERRGQLGTDAPAESLRVYGIGDVRQQDDELVAAEPGDAVAFAQDACQARADLLQQQVTVVMAERVVDLLEAVEVEQQERDPAPGPVGPPDGGKGAPA